MKHARLDEALATRAALYALGALDADEEASYRAHLESGCAVCAAEVEALTDVADSIGLAAVPVPPPPAVRERVLVAVAAPPPALPALHFLAADEGRWVRVAPGISRKYLAPEADGRSRSYLIRMEPGAVGGVHTHATVEHCLVLEGDFTAAGRSMRAGDYHRAAAGSTHVGNRTVGGCLLLLVEAAE